MPLPKFGEFFNPTLKALRDLGGSASIRELDEHVAQQLGLSEEEMLEGEVSGRPLFSYRMNWTRSYLKRYGLL